MANLTSMSSQCGLRNTILRRSASPKPKSLRRHGALDAQLLRGDMRLALEMGLAALPRFVSDRLGLPAGRPVRGGSGGAMQRVTLDEEAADESDWRGRDSREGSVEAHDGGGAAGLVAHWRAAALGLLFDRHRTAWLGEQWAELRARVAALTGGGSAHTVTSAADETTPMPIRQDGGPRCGVGDRATTTASSRRYRTFQATSGRARSSRGRLGKACPPSSCPTTWITSTHCHQQPLGRARLLGLFLGEATRRWLRTARSPMTRSAELCVGERGYILEREQ